MNKVDKPLKSLLRLLEADLSLLNADQLRCYRALILDPIRRPLLVERIDRRLKALDEVKKFEEMDFHKIMREGMRGK